MNPYQNYPPGIQNDSSSELPLDEVELHVDADGNVKLIARPKFGVYGGVQQQTPMSMMRMMQLPRNSNTFGGPSFAVGPAAPSPPPPPPFQDTTIWTVKEDEEQRAFGNTDFVDQSRYTGGLGVNEIDTWNTDSVGPAPEMSIEPEPEPINSGGGGGGGNLRKKKREPAIRWSKEEQMLFIIGIHKYKQGDWRSISRYIVTTRSPTQVASHAQKYSKRVKSKPADASKKTKRSSIHDVTVANPKDVDPAEIARLQAITKDQHQQQTNKMITN